MVLDAQDITAQMLRIKAFDPDWSLCRAYSLSLVALRDAATSRLACQQIRGQRQQLGAGNSEQLGPPRKGPISVGPRPYSLSGNRMTARLPPLLGGGAQCDDDLLLISRPRNKHVWQVFRIHQFPGPGLGDERNGILINLVPQCLGCSRRPTVDEDSCSRSTTTAVILQLLVKLVTAVEYTVRTLWPAIPPLVWFRNSR